MLPTAPALRVRLLSAGAVDSCAIHPDQLVIASWTGRDRAAMEGRLAELEALGIARPPSLPMFYRIAAARLTTAACIEVRGEDTTGEAEFVLLSARGRIWVGVGSDHTDRKLEAQDPAVSKQVCDKPVCGDFWALDELEDHWDSLRLRSFVTDASGLRAPYQEGAVSAMLPPRELLERWRRAAGPAQCSVLFCGTLPTIGSIRPAARFELQLEDPVLHRRLDHAYAVTNLPDHLEPCARSDDWLHAWMNPHAVR